MVEQALTEVTKGSHKVIGTKRRCRDATIKKLMENSANYMYLKQESKKDFDIKLHS